jgi:hypothetical protein
MIFMRNNIELKMHSTSNSKIQLLAYFFLFWAEHHCLRNVVYSWVVNIGRECAYTVLTTIHVTVADEVWHIWSSSWWVNFFHSSILAPPYVIMWRAFLKHAWLEVGTGKQYRRKLNSYSIVDLNFMYW